MGRLIIKGGYGEHGRSCFLVSFAGERYYMLDCGIMDTDEDPYPHIEKEVLSKTEYLFLSHCHKDHSGAFSRLKDQGFAGWLVASEATVRLAQIQYHKVILVDPAVAEPVNLGNGLHVLCGRSGHCVGGVWFKIWDQTGSCFYSGDYQRRPLAYACDAICGQRADMAVIDCAHPDTGKGADALRGELLALIRENLARHRRMIFPLPKYGRGMELVVLFRDMAPEARIAADAVFLETAESMDGYGEWLQPRARETIEAFLEGRPLDNLRQGRYDVLFLGDTHLELESSRKLAEREAEAGALIIVTGRVKPEGCVQSLLDSGKAVKALYPHHQSRGDFMEVIKENAFRTALPFHNPRKEVLFNMSGR